MFSTVCSPLLRQRAAALKVMVDCVQAAKPVPAAVGPQKFCLQPLRNARHALLNNMRGYKHASLLQRRQELAALRRNSASRTARQSLVAEQLQVGKQQEPPLPSSLPPPLELAPFQDWNETGSTEGLLGVYGDGRDNHNGSSAWRSGAAGDSDEGGGEAKEAEEERKPVEGKDTYIEWQVSERERVYLVGVSIRGDPKGKREGAFYSIEESLEELGRLADTAGLQVVGSTFQSLSQPNPATYIGSGKVAELAAAVRELRIETVVFDDELSPGQLRNLEKAFGGKVKVCDRTALILDIFSQRARTREGKVQVELAQVEYQLPRLTRMWTHLDRVGGGGQVKGTGEKQIETDKRELRERASQLRRELEQVRTHRRNYRNKRSQTPIPVAAIVGYTNAGKSTLLNQLTHAGVLAEDKLFATLDPTTRRVRLPTNKEVLLSDTVGFIQYHRAAHPSQLGVHRLLGAVQGVRDLGLGDSFSTDYENYGNILKLPTELVAAFRATLEEIQDAALLLHIVDISHPNAEAQSEAVEKVLLDLSVNELPLVTAWNKVDACVDPAAVRAAAAARPDTVCISGLTGEGLHELLLLIQQKVEASMVPVQVLLPYQAGDLLNEMHTVGSIQSKEYSEHGTAVSAFVPPSLAGRLVQYSTIPIEPLKHKLEQQSDVFNEDGFVETTTDGNH